MCQFGPALCTEWSELSLPPTLEGPLHIGKQEVGTIAVFMKKSWFLELQPSLWVAGTSACLHWYRDLLHCPTAGWLSALWFIGSLLFFSNTATALGRGHSYGHRTGECPALKRNLLWPNRPGLVLRGPLAAALIDPLPPTSKGGNRWWGWASPWS
jgi:hypothetical protein